MTLFQLDFFLLVAGIKVSKFVSTILPQKSLQLLMKFAVGLNMSKLFGILLKLRFNGILCTLILVLRFNLLGLMLPF